MMRQGLRPQGLKRLWLATGHSLRGLRLSYSSEAAFRQEVWLAVVLLPLAFFLGGAPWSALCWRAACSYS